MKNLCLLCLILAALCACTSRTADVELSAIEAVMTEYPDSALSLLQEIDPRHLSRADNALYALLLSQAKDKCYIDETNDSLINIAVEYYDGNNNMRYRGMSYFYLSRINENTGNYELALENSISAEEALLSTDDSNMLALVYANRADIYKEQFRVNDAINLYRKAIEYYRKVGNWRNIVYSHLAASTCYMVSQHPDSAMSEINQARNIAKRLDDKEVYLHIENCTASFYEYNKEPEKAIAILQKVIKQCHDHNLNADNYLLICRIYHSIGMPDSALYYLDNFYAQTCQTQSEIKTLNLFKSELYQALGDYKEAYKTLHEYLEIVIDIGLWEQNKSIPELEKKYRTRILQHKNEILKTRNTALGLILLLTIIIAVLFVLLFIKQRHLRIVQYDQFCEQLSMSATSMQQRYNEIEESLKKQKADNLLYNSALKQRIDSLHSLTGILESGEFQKEDSYNKIRDYFSLCDSNKNSFANEIRQIISLYSSDLVETLQVKYPSLSNEEVTLCCMLALGFDINQIRILYNHKNLQSIYNKRTKLRKKLNLDTEQEIEKFLIELVNQNTATI